MTITKTGLLVCMLGFGCSVGPHASSPDALGPVDETRLVLPPTARVYVDQHVTGYPHPIDIYLPSNATRAMVFLHGGGGTKEQMANSVGIKTDSSTSDHDFDSSWLINQRVAAVFPQGQQLPGTNAPTWSNYVMTSGQDDEAFLIALSNTLRQFPSIQEVYLVGHSNGGMMANRMWCEAPAAYDGYGGVSGPPSTHLDPISGSAPCHPSTVRRYVGIVGSDDRILQIGGNWTTPTWTLASVTTLLTSPSEWYDPNPAPHQVINEALFQLFRARKMCSSLQGGTAVDSADGKTTTWTNCSGALKLIRVNGANHCIAPLNSYSTPGCGVNDPNNPPSLTAVSGLDIKSVLLDSLSN